MAILPRSWNPYSWNPSKEYWERQCGTYTEKIVEYSYTNQLVAGVYDGLKTTCCMLHIGALLGSYNTVQLECFEG